MSTTTDGNTPEWAMTETGKSIHNAIRVARSEWFHRGSGHENDYIANAVLEFAVPCAPSEAELEKAVSDAFRKHRNQVGDHWCWEWAVRENDAEDFAKSVLSSLNINPPKK
jgi:hypothetical protein